MEDNLNLKGNSINRPASKVLKIFAVVAVMVGLCLSPLLTLGLFHPDGPSIKLDRLVDLIAMQIYQIEPLLLSFVALWHAFVQRNVSLTSKFLWAITIVEIHIFVAFLLISVRAEGALMWIH